MANAAAPKASSAKASSSSPLKRKNPSRAADQQPNKKQKGASGPKKSSDGARFKPKPTRDAAPAPRQKLSRQEQKEAKREKHAKLKKNFNVIQDVVQLWEALRPKNTSQQEKEQLVTKIMSKVEGKVLELAGHHTASRVIQFCAKHGTPAQRTALTSQLRAAMVPLSKTKYGKHLVCKLINMAKKEEVPGMVAQFKGQMAELLRHPHAADVLVDLYDVAPTSLRNAMCAEFYGKEFVLFDGVQTLGSSVTSLKQLLAGVAGAKRRSVFQHMTRALQPVMEKALLHPPMVHRLLRDFFECAPAMSIEDATDTLSASGTDVLKMVHTHDGAAVACMLFAYGSARDRKRLLKAMKGYVRETATNEWGHAVVCMALSVVDDTPLLNKCIISELKAMLPELVEDQYGHRVLLQLLSPYNRRYLPPAIMEMLQPPQRTITGSTGKMVTDLEGDEDELHGLGSNQEGGDEEGDELFVKPKGSAAKDKGKNGKRKQQQQGEAEEDDAGPRPKPKGKAGKGDEDEEEDEGEEAAPQGPRVLGLSKKDPLLRRKELLGGGGSSLAHALTQLCASQAASQLRSPVACNVVVEVARGGEAGLLEELCSEGVAEVQQAVAELAARTEESEEGPSSDEAGPGPRVDHVLLHWYGSRALRRYILLSGDETSTQCAVRGVELLWKTALHGKCKRWVGTHADKVLAALLHCGSDTVKQAAAKELRPLVKGKSLEAWSAALTQQHPHHAAATGGAADAKAASAPSRSGKSAVQAQAATPAAAQSGKQIQAGAGGNAKTPSAAPAAKTPSAAVTAKKQGAASAKRQGTPAATPGQKKPKKA
mmetsp:Transcript_35571/g.78981  ORF Transcript_35571/g.78981 Transcript_35571/m.78981 type:complete len:822 (-) Transcript_35571:289-2754(-)